MLELRNIKKDYYVADDKVEALKGVNISFRKNEFVAILGPSGCGKTTLLNIVGGLDRYTDGDLIIRGKSTKEFKDHEWDSYRNHTIGFVFQNYNLIPHQTVLENVELALTLSGVSKAERRKRAIDALVDVGLADKMNNKPNQLSGGQMQRVAIARALVNNPDILLADEPTGALDTKTSVQIMDILKSIARDKLIIMVTHNPQLADEYANRIIKLVDGLVIDDSNPYNAEYVIEETLEVVSKKEKKRREKKTSMSFFTALSLSFKNLLTKKARTLMVAFAGSIGIIGIALILSVSNGFQNYIDKVQEDTLSTYPISIETVALDTSTMLAEMTSISKPDVEVTDGYITSNDTLLQMVELAQRMKEQAVVTNNLKAFKTYIETTDVIKENSNAIQYVYNMDLNIYNKDGKQINPNNIFKLMMGDAFSEYESMLNMAGATVMSFGFNVWAEMLDNPELIQSQYDLLDGAWPTKYNEVVVVVDENNQISDYVLYSLGLKDQSEIEDILGKLENGETVKTEKSNFTYQEILDLEYDLVLPHQYFERDNELGYWKNIGDSEGFYEKVKDDSIKLDVVGILRPKDSASATSIGGTIGYMSSLALEYTEKVKKSFIYQEQELKPEIDVFTGQEFMKREELDSILEQLVTTMFPEDSDYAKTMLTALKKMSVEELSDWFAEYGVPFNVSNYDLNLRKLGYIDYDDPKTINIYPKDFAAKDLISEEINKYNQEVASKDQITYTDYIGIFLSSISIIIDVITYVLIAFVAISLVVSSIMIGVITYISVLERTKEIGILRSIGARKSDISRVFTAETVVVGFAAGALGILISVLLIIPINLIINALAGFPINAASLPWLGGLILIVISVILTVIAGLFPSKLAAKRDPVEALRSE